MICLFNTLIHLLISLSSVPRHPFLNKCLHCLPRSHAKNLRIIYNSSLFIILHIQFISKFYWLSLPSKYWQIPKSEKFPDALTVEGLGSIPGLRELRSHKPHSTAKKKTTTNFQILTTFHSFYCYLHYHILSQLLPYPLTGSPAIALCLPPTILKVVCRLCAMLC